MITAHLRTIGLLSAFALTAGCGNAAGSGDTGQNSPEDVPRSAAAGTTNVGGTGGTGAPKTTGGAGGAGGAIAMGAAGSGGKLAGAGGTSGMGGTSVATDAGAAPVTAAGCPTSQAPGTWQNITAPTMKMTGDYINGPITVGVDVVRPSDVYVNVQQDGTWKSSDCGLTWKKMTAGTSGDAQNSGRQWYSAIDQNPKRDPMTPPTMYVIAGYGALGIWKSTNGGVDWTSVWNDNVFAPDGVTNISKDVGSDLTGVMLVDASGPNHLIAFLHGYFGTSDNNGVFESTDGGAKWMVHKSSLFAFQPHADVLFAVDTSTWIVSHGTVYPNTVAYRTTDSGGTWNLATGSTGSSMGRSHFVTGSTIYAGTDFIGGLYKSPDRGASWSKLAAGNQTSWAVATKTQVYSSSGRDNPHIWHAALANDAVWADDGNPTGMKSGGSQTPGVIFDGEHYVLIVAQEMGGLWRYVEP